MRLYIYDSIYQTQQFSSDKMLFFMEVHSAGCARNPFGLPRPALPRGKSTGAHETCKNVLSECQSHVCACVRARIDENTDNRYTGGRFDGRLIEQRTST